MTQSMILGILAALSLSTEFEPRAEKNIIVDMVVLEYTYELKFKRIEKKVNRAFITDTNQIQPFSWSPPYAVAHGVRLDSYITCPLRILA